jgi:hypothetical protein
MTPRRFAAAATLALALAAGGCSSSDSSSPAAAPTTSDSSVGGARPVASKVLLGKVAGTIRKKSWKEFMTHHRKHLLNQVGKSVDTWIDGGFVGVEYPRHSFPKAFVRFTHPAKRDAKGQRRLMTNWDLRRRIDGLDVKRRKITVDVLAPRGRPAGATARVDLVFTTTGDAEQRVEIRGRLFLSPARHGTWRVFGYDVSRGAK